MTHDDQQAAFKSIPRERWPRALAAVLLQGFTNHPEVLLSLVLAGEDLFVDVAERHDQFGLTRKEYKHIYKRLCRAATRLGLTTRVQ